VVLDPEAGTVRCAANHAPLTPISFVERAAAVYGGRPAVVYGERRRTWSEVRDRCVRVAAALVTRFGVARGDVVSENLTLSHTPRSRRLVISLA
jgi:acyl-CoA synthetase (AMP-forming)/AMP-acid ligase II